MSNTLDLGRSNSLNRFQWVDSSYSEEVVRRIESRFPSLVTVLQGYRPPGLRDRLLRGLGLGLGLRGRSLGYILL